MFCRAPRNRGSLRPVAGASFARGSLIPAHEPARPHPLHAGAPPAGTPVVEYVDATDRNGDSGEGIPVRYRLVQPFSP